MRARAAPAVGCVSGCVLACVLALSACGGGAGKPGPSGLTGGGGAGGAVSAPDAAAPDLATSRDASVPEGHPGLAPSDARRDAIPMLGDAMLAGACGAPGAKCPTYGGSTVWSFRSPTGLSASMGPDGAMYIGGGLNNTLDLDPTQGVDLVGTEGQSSAFLMKLGPTGAYASTMAFAGNLFGYPGVGAASVTANASFVLGWFDGGIDLDPGPGVDQRTSTLTRGGSFVSKFTAAGKYVWGRVLTGTDSGLMSWGRVVAASDGGAFATGTYAGPGDLDPGPAELAPPNDRGAFVSRLDVNGKLVWVRTFGGDECDWAGIDAQLDAAGVLWLLGSVSGNCAFDKNGPAQAGPGGFFIASMLADGTIRTFGSITGGADLKGLQVARDGSIYLAGSVGLLAPGQTRLPIDFDPSSGVSERTVGDTPFEFVMKLDNSGKLRWLQQLDSRIDTFALAADDGVIAMGASDDGLVGARVFALDAGGHETWRFQVGGRNLWPLAVLPGASGFFLLGQQSSPGDLDPSTNVDRYEGEIVFLSKYTF